MSLRNNPRGADMTCIAGLVDKGKVWIGGDSFIGSADSFDYDLSDSKVFRKGEFLYGCSGDARDAQILKYIFRPPAQPKRMSDLTYLATTYVDALRDLMVEQGRGVVEEGVSKFNGHLLIGYRGSLYELLGTYTVLRSPRKMAAMGCGNHLALGAMSVAKGTGRERVKAALEAAAMWSAGVKPPFKIKGI